MTSLALASLVVVIVGGSMAVSCSSDPAAPQDAGSPGRADASTADRARLDGAVRLDAACVVTLETPELMPADHIDPRWQPQYNSNPPSSGPHFGIWASFKEYDRPVDRRYLVHSMEHGAVVIFYKCDDAGACPQVAAAREAVAALPDDPACAGQGARVRAIIVPDPQIDVPIAAAAWGWVYKAQCIDLPTLKQFARDHAGKGPEDVCVAGQSEF
jgi:hypothetical protein